MTATEQARYLVLQGAMNRVVSKLVAARQATPVDPGAVETLTAIQTDIQAEKTALENRMLAEYMTGARTKTSEMVEGGAVIV